MEMQTAEASATTVLTYPMWEIQAPAPKELILQVPINPSVYYEKSYQGK